MLELKIFLFWVVFTSLMWIATKIHHTITDTCLNWKTFKNDYSLFGEIYYFSLYLGYTAISVYLFIKAFEWWFR